jgi:hypothetical protein
MKTEVGLVVLMLIIVIGCLVGAMHKDTLDYELERAKLQVTCK